MEEISEEMRRSLWQELANDGQRVYERCAQMQQPIKREYGEIHATLEQIAYITEQMRLKLKILGAPRIW